MRLVAKAKPLLAALAPAVAVVARRSSIPILQNIRLDAGENGVTFTGYDLDKQIRSTLACAVDGPQSLTAPAHLLLDLLRKLSADAEVKFEANGLDLAVKSGRARFQLQTLPVEDFPAFIDGPEPSARFSCPAADLAALLQFVTPAISTEETRYYLNGVFLHALADQLVAVATDGHRLARRALSLPEGAATMPGIIIPRLAIAEIIKLCASAEKSDEPAIVEISPALLRVDFGAASLATKLVDGTFPDYQRILPTPARRLTLNRAALAAMLERVAVIATTKSRAVKFTFAGSLLTVSALNTAVGEASEEIELDERLDLVTGFNSAYVLEMLATFSDERIELGLTDPGSPMLIEPFGDHSRLAVIMPQRF